MSTENSVLIFCYNAPLPKGGWVFIRLRIKRPGDFLCRGGGKLPPCNKTVRFSFIFVWDLFVSVKDCGDGSVYAFFI